MIYSKSSSNRPSQPGRPRFPGRGGPRRGASKRKKAGLDPALFVRKAIPPASLEVHLPAFDYADLDVQPTLRANILKKGYKTPTPIQDLSIPHVLAGKDVLGIANTGTGKTAAFLIPLTHKILKNKEDRVLIVVPTREIASQIQDEFLSFKQGIPIFSAVCVGGVSIGGQIAALRRNPQVLIATPGRLMDLMERRMLRMELFNHLVLDEADRMVDMGFINDIRKIVSALPKERQSLFFTATLSREIKELIHTFLKDPVHVSVKTHDTAAHVDQDVVHIGPGEDKMTVLVKMLRESETFCKVLIFGRTKRGVERIAVSLKKQNFGVVSIHGDKPQRQRQKALDIFKQNKATILVATDVAARGLDIPNVSHVINYDAPDSYDDYVHRIGRTGRANKTGSALTFVQKEY